MKRKWRYIALFFLLFSFWGTVKGQVTIGEAVDPQNFSILELISHHTGGLRLPHLTTAERDALDETDEFQAQKRRGDYATAPGLGLGLVIYNTDTNCTEYWNGYKWVSLCLGTADITLKSSCGGYYNPQSLPTEPANGDSPNCEYTPEDNPTCTVPSGKAYEVYLTAGAAYANLQVDELTSAFSIGFSPNNSNLTRNAVVRVVNNCTG
ncbi:MAG: hypothetical protein LBH12_04470, partial [Dysgonamonadaceae bacterium]|nr:hypothetical protein [Dysgonamonadaceae bacterium]